MTWYPPHGPGVKKWPKSRFFDAKNDPVTVKWFWKFRESCMGGNTFVRTTFRFKSLWESHFSRKSQVRKNVKNWPRTILRPSFVPKFQFYSEDKYFLAHPIWRKNQIYYFKAELQPILLFFDVKKWPSAWFWKEIRRDFRTTRSNSMKYTKCIDQIFKNIAPTGLWVTFCIPNM